jgi:hypothetical protein
MLGIIRNMKKTPTVIKVVLEIHNHCLQQKKLITIYNHNSYRMYSNFISRNQNQCFFNSKILKKLEFVKLLTNIKYL